MGDKRIFALLIIGSRSIDDYSLFKKKVEKLTSIIRDKYELVIVSGGAKGVDTLAERYAKENGYRIKIITADWSKYGNSAGYIRNEELHRFIKHFDHRGCIAFWDGKSKGTQHSFELAKKYNTPIRIIRCDIKEENHDNC